MKNKNANTKSAPALAGIIFFLAAFPYMEICLRISDTSGAFSFLWFLRSTLSGICFGAFLLLIACIIPKKVASRVIIAAVFFILAVFFVEEACTKSEFGLYFQISFMFSMTGNVVGNFFGDMMAVILKKIWMIPAEFAPGIIFIVFRRHLVPFDSVYKRRSGKTEKTHGPDSGEIQASPRKARAAEIRNKIPARNLFALALFLISLIASLISCHIGGDNRFYTYNYNANDAIPRFGLINTLRLEVQYAVFGMPIENIEIIPDETTEEDLSSGVNGTGEVESESAKAAAEPETEAVTVYEPNEMDIDFDELIASDTSDVYTMMDTYFKSQTPTLKNGYTGLFEGKNLVFITAEAFSYINIDEERTPALYKLTHTGFVFNNYYQPDFSQSTTGGEFANMTGLIPMWINGNTAYIASASNYMPFGFGTIFNNLGYNVTAYHDGEYTYYDRNLTHPNMGYDFYGIGNGLDMESVRDFPESDLEMFQLTVPEKIDAYLETGTPFHLYYMSISGHGGYSWGNAMSAKNREVTDGITGYTVIDSYYAANMELEYALEYLLEELEKADILDDTVIVMGTDHYPYFMTEGQDADYFAIAAGFDGSENSMERYRNSLILWCGSVEETIEIDTPCSSIDIVPTLLNLFGIEYDSRLFSGRDIFAGDAEIGAVSSDMHVVCFLDDSYGNSWISAAGQYDGTTGIFYANEGVELEDEQEYIDKMCELVSQRCTMAKYIVQYDYYSHVFMRDLP